MTDRTNQRVLLAEAMGWTSNVPDVWWPPGNKRWRKAPPDPENDANDDYAVLEWIRSQHFVTYLTAHLEHEYTQDYKIGDYARAALKVIE